MRVKAAILLSVVVAATFTALADAQIGGGWGTGTGETSNTMPNVLPQGDDWTGCANRNHRISLERAIAACTRVIADRPARETLGAALWYRASAYEYTAQPELRRADLERAVEVYRLQIEERPHEGDGYYNRGTVYMAMEDYDRAMTDFDGAITNDIYLADAHSGRGSILFRRGDYTGAIREFDEAARLRGRRQEVDSGDYSDRCEVRAAAATDLEAGRRHCDRAVSRSSGVDGLVARGYFRFMQGEFDTAADDFRRAVDRDASDPIALYGRGVTAVRLGREAEGEADIAHARALSQRRVDYYANAGLRP